MAAQGAEPRRASLTPEQWRRVGELFHEALDLRPEDRQDWIARQSTIDPEVCSEVMSLIENDRTVAAGFVERGVKSAVVSMFEPEAAPGQRIGPYKLLRELGRGGMGTVYLAERDDEQYHTLVAIKLVRPGMDTEVVLHRFRRERQTLARLEHPHIARLLDGGTTPDGRPYIVMEYIDGVPITEYCRDRKLSVSERLQLFLNVCSAVEYAHHHFIVHRDIKPGNILVSDSGVSKLLDFGICKLLQTDMAASDTGTHTMQMLTPEYASPEQVRGDPVTIASDIYSLAAVLYEMLTGFRPHRLEKLTPQAVERAICETEVIRPSLVPDKALARRLQGDLDNILLLALQKDPQRRYASVEQFSEDIRRHLSFQPVRARPDTLSYRARKFARRQRNVLVAAGVVILSLAVATWVSVREARTSRENLLQARRLANVFVFEVHDAVRDLPGSTRARQLIVETGLRYLDNLAKNSRRDWELQFELATAYQRIGDVQGNVRGANLGNTQGALGSYEKAITLLDAVVDHDGTNRGAQLARLTVQQRIGALCMYTQDSRRALASFREAERLGETLLMRDPEDIQIARELAQIHTATAEALSLAGSFSDSIAENYRAVTLALNCLSKHPGDVLLQQTLAAAYSAIGLGETRLGRLQEGLDQYRRALDILQELGRQNQANAPIQRLLLATYSHLGDALGNPKWHSIGDTAGAIKAYREMLSVARRLHETDPANQQAANDYAIALTRMAAVMAEREFPQRLAMLRESLDLLVEIQRVNPQNVLNRWDLVHGFRLLGDALVDSDHAGAMRAYEESRARAEALISMGVVLPVPDLVTVLEQLGLDAARRGDRSEAITHARRAFELTDPAGPLGKGRAENVQRLLTPRGTGAMGLIYAQLARDRSGTPLSAADRQLGAEWLGKSLAAWRELVNDPAFAPPQRHEMQQVEEALAAVRK